jgi:hypothetical protein
MKNILTKTYIPLALTVIIFSITTLSGCKKDDPKPKPTDVEKATTMLTSRGGRWLASGSAAITVDGLDVTQDLFPNFAITFSEKTFRTSGTSPIWLREDTWSFKDETATIIVRGQDGKEITITALSDTQLKLSMAWDQTTYDGGRSKSVAGTYEYILSK